MEYVQLLHCVQRCGDPGAEDLFELLIWIKIVALIFVIWEHIFLLIQS